jgi:SMODS-associating 2TM, beta-strand rich effector domain
MSGRADGSRMSTQATIDSDALTLGCKTVKASTVTSEVPARPNGDSAERPTRGWHLYSASDVKRVTVVSVLGTMAAILATGIVLLLALRFPHLGTQLSAWTGVLIASALGALIFAGFEKRAWRWRATAWVPHCTMPDLSGGWSGRIEITKGKEGENIGEPLTCRVEIRQDWSRIAIDFETDVSESWSVMANVDARRAGENVHYELHYEYYVIPKPNAPRELANKVELIDPHYGTARVKLVGRGPWPSVRTTELRGIWFNDQHFERWGTIELTRNL